MYCVRVWLSEPLNSFAATLQSGVVARAFVGFIDMETSPTQKRNRGGIVLALLALLAAVVATWFIMQRPSNDLPSGVSIDQYRAAAAAFEQAYDHQPDEMDVYSWLAESSEQQDDLETAVVCFEQIPTDHPQYGIASRVQQAHVLLRLNRVYECEQNLNEVLNAARENPHIELRRLLQTLDLKRYLLGVELRFEERQDILRVIYELGAADKDEITTLFFPSLLRWNGPQAAQELEEFWRADKDCYPLRVALGRYRTGQGRLDESQQILSDCLAERPREPRATAAMLECLREQGDWEGMERYLTELPEPKESDPWLLLLMRGHAANQRKSPEQAIPLFQMVLRHDPTNAEACQGLITAHRALGHDAELRELTDRAQLLARIQNRLGWVQTAEDPSEGMLEIAELSLKINYDEGARGMVTYVREHTPHAAIPESLRQASMESAAHSNKELIALP